MKARTKIRFLMFPYQTIFKRISVISDPDLWLMKTSTLVSSYIEA